MLVLLLGKNNIYKTNLPPNISGEYWISDEVEKKDLIKIEAINGVWKIVSNSYAKIINPKYLKIDDEFKIENADGIFGEKANLKEDGMYVIALGSINNIYILFCMPDSASQFLHMEINNTKEFTIGSNPKNSIVYTNVLASDVHAKIVNKDSKWYIQNFDSKIGTFVNNSQIGKEITSLSNGDIILVLGLKIVLINNHIFINNFLNNVKLNKNIFRPSKIKSQPLNLDSFEPDENIELIKEENFFSRAPRITDTIEVEKIIIDPPPQNKDDEQKPLLLTLGPSIAFGIVSFVSFFTIIHGIIKGKSTLGNNVTALLFPFVTLISMLLIPILNMKYEKRKKEQYEIKRQQRYKEYLNKKKNEINKIKEKQRAILLKKYLSPENSIQIIFENSHRLWERKIEDSDFLNVRLGSGNVPLKVKVRYPEERFAMEDDDLLDIFNNIFEITKYIENAPITTSLLDNVITSFIFENKDFSDKFMKNIILQLITFQSYEDLNLVFLVDDLDKWQYVRMLPHLWDSTKKIRFFADDFSTINEISKFLLDELKNRLEDIKENDKKEFYYTPQYLIITDNYKKIEDFSFFNELAKIKQNIGFSLLCITDDFYKLPNECRFFVKIENDKGSIFDKENVNGTQKEFIFDDLIDVDFDSVSQILANIPIRLKTKGTYSLPTSYSFLNMYNVGNIKNLNIWDRWRGNDSSVSLKAQIGIDSSENPIYLDIHEKYHGPHGLIAGSTGSGKSEFIMTYILSLAVNFHPNDVNFLLIDYKGGGLAGAFQKSDFKLPHLVGTITNIDKEGLQRSLISVQSELRRRQVLFNEVRDRIDEGTIDIYKYQRLYHSGIIKEPISHLLIICDEFAELKQQQPEFMEELMSVSRIGRSLGVHLILATQKPAGIVNDQIRSNSKFSVCLKVQDTHDSMDVIKRSDAAFLKNPGQFYFQVGNGEYFVLGQSGWAGATYIPSKTTNKKLDTSVEFISDIGYSIKRIEDVVSKANDKSKGEQLSNIVKYICELAKQQNINPKSLWLDTIPENIYVKEIREKYNFKNEDESINVVLGEYDDPANQSQGIVKLNLLKKENIIVYGNAESGKETLLSTFIYDTITNYSSEKIQYYLLDFGSEALKVYSKCPHVGDVIFINDSEKLNRLFEILQNKIKDRKAILSSCNGDYNIYLSKGNVMPLIVCMLNNYENFSEVYDMKFDEKISYITREGPQYGILFIISCSSSSSIRFRLKQNFIRKIVLQLNKADEYIDIYGKSIKINLPHIFGRGFTNLETDEIYEFQTAKICEHKDYNNHLEEITEVLNQCNNIKAEPIPIVPEYITVSSLKNMLQSFDKVPIGMIKDNLKICTYDFKSRFMTVVGAKNVSNAIKFMYFVIEEIKELPKLSINILDAEDVKRNKEITFKEAFEQFCSKIESDINNTDYEFCFSVIIGINKFISDGGVSEMNLSEFMKKTNNSEKCSFVIIDNPTLLKKFAYSDWYRNNVSQDAGIWVGNGISDQNLINNNTRFPKEINSCDCSYGFVINEGEATYLKLLGMKKESGD